MAVRRKTVLSCDGVRQGNRCPEELVFTVNPRDADPARRNLPALQFTEKWVRQHRAWSGPTKDGKHYCGPCTEARKAKTP